MQNEYRILGEQIVVGNRDNAAVSLRSGRTGRGCLHI